MPALEKRVQELDGACRTACVWALLQIRPGDQQLEAKALPLLIEALNHEQELVRVEAATCLGGMASAATPEIIAKLKELADKVPTTECAKPRPKQPRSSSPSKD